MLQDNFRYYKNIHQVILVKSFPFYIYFTLVILLLRTFLLSTRQQQTTQKSYLFIQYNVFGTRGSLITCAQHITEELSLKHGGLAENQYIVFILQVSTVRQMTESKILLKF